MPDSAATLSAAILRLAGEVGYATLDWLAAAPPAASAELDQHVAAVRADLARCQRPGGKGRPGRGTPTPSMRRAVARRDAAADRAPGGPGEVGPASDPACPDVPFAASPLQAEPVLPLTLLLHYVCGLVEAAVRDDWWPGDVANGEVDWACLRLAALCKLISQTEADAELHPDLRNFA
jgi:Family of unknown function (DUF6401)